MTIKQDVAKEMYLAIKRKPTRTNAHIAAQFGVSAATVQRFRKKHGLPSNPSTRLGQIGSNRERRSTDNSMGTLEKVAEIRYYIKKFPHATVRQVGEALGIPETTVRGLIKKYNIPYTRKQGVKYTPFHDVDKLEVKAYIEAHPEKTLKQFADRYHTSPRVIHNFIKKYGIVYVTKQMSMDQEVQVSEMLELIREHPEWTIVDLSNELGYGETTIRRYIKKHNIPYEKKHR